jgi:hypothetical protein
VKVLDQDMLEPFLQSTDPMIRQNRKDLCLPLFDVAKEKAGDINESNIALKIYLEVQGIQ